VPPPPSCGGPRAGAPSSPRSPQQAHQQPRLHQTNKMYIKFISNLLAWRGCTILPLDAENLLLPPVVAPEQAPHAPHQQARQVGHHRQLPRLRKTGKMYNNSLPGYSFTRPTLLLPSGRVHRYTLYGRM
jgi:hypothetical protein